MAVAAPSPARSSDAPAPAAASELTVATLDAASVGLTAADATTYRSLFEAEAKGDVKRADQLANTLQDRRLLGHALAIRHLRPAARPSAEDLQLWLSLYGDQPQAAKIARRLKNAPHQPGRIVNAFIAPGSWIGQRPTCSSRAPVLETTSSFDRSGNGLASRLRNLLESDQASEALRLVRGGAPASPVASITSGKRKKAPKVSAATGSVNAPEVQWLAGLAAWRAAEYEAAAEFFLRAASASNIEVRSATAAHFWAARSLFRAHKPAQAFDQLRLAAAEPSTFYGLLAASQLGLDLGHSLKTGGLTRTHIDLVAAEPAGARALALIAVGQPQLADDELSGIACDATAPQRTALRALTDMAELSGLQTRLAGSANGSQRVLASYRPPALTPAGGFKLDRALLFAIARTESRFDARARNPHTGAAGLMQLMPSTARAVAGRALKADELMNASTNLAIGQKLVERLLGQEKIDGDLARMLVAYNAGDGNLYKYIERAPRGADTLYFIEWLPNAETRNFIELVMASYWLYQLQDGHDPQSLEAMARGEGAVYAAGVTSRGTRR